MHEDTENAITSITEPIGELAEAAPVAKNILKVAEVVYNRWEKHQIHRITQMLSNVGDELRYGDNNDDWNEFLSKIDDPRIHATVVNAARAAIDSFDEAAIPYLARVVAWHVSGNGPVTRETRWLLKLFSECDDELLSGLKHLIEKVISNWDGEKERGSILVVKRDGENQAGLENANMPIDEERVMWPTEGHDYISVFEVLKKNYYGTDETAGVTGTITGPYIVVVEREKMRHLSRILFYPVPE